MSQIYSAVFLEYTDGEPTSISGTAKELIEKLEKKKVCLDECIFFKGEPINVEDVG